MSLVCWSGGLDSTLVLYTLAKEQRDGTKFHADGVRALTVTHSQISCNQRQAIRARTALKKKFTSLGFIISYIDITVNQTAASWRDEQFICRSDNPQALLWLTIAANYLGNTEDLYPGYIKGDDFWHRAGTYDDIFRSIQVMAGRTGHIIHKLEWFDKADVIDLTKKFELYDYCWWCEEMKPPMVSRKVVPCGKCASCIVNDMALLKLEKYGATCSN